MAKKVAFVGKIQPGKRKKQKYCKCKEGGLVILNFDKGESTCPICDLPKKLKSARNKNMLKAGTKLWKDKKGKTMKTKKGIFNKEEMKGGINKNGK